MKLQTKIKIIRWVEKLLRTGSPVSPLTKSPEIFQYDKFPVIRIQQSALVYTDRGGNCIAFEAHKAFLQDKLWDAAKHAIVYQIIDSRLHAELWIVDRRNQKPAGEITWQSGNRTFFDENGDLIDTDTQLDIKRVLTDKNKEGLDVPPDNE